MYLYMFPKERDVTSTVFILENYHMLTRMTEQEIFGELEQNLVIGLYGDGHILNILSLRIGNRFLRYLLKPKHG